MVTGADSGLGLETSRELLKQGYYVIMDCRNLMKGENARIQLIKETGNSNINLQKLDLNSMAAVRAFARAVEKDVYGLVCNAGLQNSRSTLYTEDGVEQTFGVNYLSHFLLTNLLLARNNNNLKRLVLVSSSLHDPAIGGPKPPKLEDTELMAHPLQSKTANPMGLQRYSTSKLCLVLFTYNLDDLLKKNNRENVLVNAFNPGLMADTTLVRNSTFMTGMVWFYVLPVLSKFMKGASTTERSGKLLTDLISQVKVSGKYFDIDKISSSSSESYDKAKAEQLWEGSEQLCQLQASDKWYSHKKETASL